MTTTRDQLYRYEATVVRVLDGDTFEAMCDLGFRAWYRCSCRVLDLWCPELSESGGYEAKYAALDLFLGRIPSPPPVLIHSTKLDGFGRALVAVTLADGTDFATRMIEGGYGTATKGGA